MPKYKVMATEYVFKDALIEAKDAEEACEKAQADNVDWITAVSYTHLTLPTNREV